MKPQLHIVHSSAPARPSFVREDLQVGTDRAGNHRARSLPERILLALLALIIVVAVLSLHGCVPAPVQIVKPVTVEVPRYVQVPIPAQLLQLREVVEPAPACVMGTEHVFCNGQLAQLLDGYRAALRASNADKQALRALNTNASPTTPAGAGERAPAGPGGTH